MNVIARIKARLQCFLDLEKRLDSHFDQFVDIYRRYSSLGLLVEELKTRVDVQTGTIETLLSRVQRLEERPERTVEVGDLIARVSLLEADKAHHSLQAQAVADAQSNQRRPRNQPRTVWSEERQEYIIIS